ncbi:MAG: hypothetical protein ACD_2C00001G0004 [uncultured bacterium (gcode 4)]|uniref:Aminoglycoside phosphotransferase domain-containing protein n=1 Tax=uncultured bacterium (gcode 4) TaxID=1234023 RepID=K2GIR0_9BACT|nr:MAG: hypothetical protein ACD_2C00001G0004 [uncultured bacterium (gcode 4)]
MDNKYHLVGQIDLENLNKIIIPVTKNVFNSRISEIKRFPTGSCHFVYDAVLESWENLVFRIGYSDSNKAKIGWSVFWHGKLKELGIKIPALLYHDVSCIEYGKPFTVSERIRWDDIWNAIDSLTDENLDLIAKEIAGIQNRISTLEPWRWFWEMTSYDDANLKGKWREFVLEKFEKAKMALSEGGIFDDSYIERVREALDRNSWYLENVKGTMFFDDITSKNIIVDNSEFSWVVDFDTMTCWDRLYWLGLCNMAFIYLEREIYISYLIRYLGCSEDDISAMNLYTLLFCLDFMSEIGQKFNKEEAIIDYIKAERYKSIFERICNNIK